MQGKLYKDIGCIYKGPSGTNKSLNLVINHCDGGLVSEFKKLAMEQYKI